MKSIQNSCALLICILAIMINISQQAHIMDDDLDLDESNPILTSIVDDDSVLDKPVQPLDTTDLKKMDQLIYEMIETEAQHAIHVQFESLMLRAITMKTKLDAKIDNAILMLESLKNLRYQLDSAHRYANRLMKSKVITDKMKKYVLKQLDHSMKQFENALNQHDETVTKINIADKKSIKE
ncbi:hypothetical protein RDWZM_000775 [Blomia tropicalis]|uniref:Uncharacterized protein n=1 Tax=Blomia tropicalis TaxID=40697 RepID=A0A9Q0MEP4_BLOTA|nr:hypothetical protein RDWZM_000775 [Blomia tropicalis]